MEGFRPETGALVLVLVSYLISAFHFLNAILLNVMARKGGKPWNPASLKPCLWGFAFALLGHLGTYLLANNLPVDK